MAPQWNPAGIPPPKPDLYLVVFNNMVFDVRYYPAYVEYFDGKQWQTKEKNHITHWMEYPS